METKDKDLDYIKKFSKISVQEICKQENVNRSNLLYGRSTKENSKKVRRGIESEIAKLYVKRIEDERSDKDEEIKVEDVG